MEGHGSGNQRLIENFVNLIRGKETEPVAPLKAGIVSAEICQAAKGASEQMEYQRI